VMQIQRSPLPAEIEKMIGDHLYSLITEVKVGIEKK
jgi:hypothetical protein